MVKPQPRVSSELAEQRASPEQGLMAAEEKATRVRPGEVTTSHSYVVSQAPSVTLQGFQPSALGQTADRQGGGRWGGRTNGSRGGYQLIGRPIDCAHNARL